MIKAWFKIWCRYTS